MAAIHPAPDAGVESVKVRGLRPRTYFSICLKVFKRNLYANSRIMKQYWIVYLLFIAFYISGCSAKMAPQGHYQDSLVVADGNAGEWPLPLRFSNEKNTFQYTVTHDNQFLYLCLLSRDPATQERMLKDGMTLYFDPTGKKKTEMSLAYPVRKMADRENYSRYRNRNGNPIRPRNEDSVIREWVQQADYLTTKGLHNIENGQFGIRDKSSHIRVALKLHNDSALIYEAVIPLDILSVDLSVKKAKNFSLGIALNAVAAQRNAYMNNRAPRSSMGGMRGGMMGGGMRGGGGYGGGRGAYSSPESLQEIKEETTWYTFSFAVPDKKK